jgi:hypothetical protein
MIHDEVTIKRLVLVKRLYLEGVEKASHRHNYSDQMLAVINLFLAVETLMGSVVLAADEQPEKAVGTKGYVGGPPNLELVSRFKMGDYHKFEQLYNQVVAILRSCGSGILGQDERLFNWGALERLQKARNDAQHGAKAPHPSDLPELTAIAREFIERVIQLYFPHLGSSLAEISLANLIEDDVLRQFIEHAETTLGQGQFKTCALLVRVAFLLGRLKRRYDWWKDRKGRRVIDDYDVSRQTSRDWGVRPLESNADTRLLHNIMTETLKLPVLFDNWILGLDKMDRDKLSELTPRLVRYPEGTKGFPPSDEVVLVDLMDNLLSGKDVWPESHFAETPSRDDCLWILDYTIETLLRWQQEQRGRYTAIDPKYLKVLPELEKFFDIEDGRPTRA